MIEGVARPVFKRQCSHNFKQLSVKLINFDTGAIRATYSGIQ